MRNLLILFLLLCGLQAAAWCEEVEEEKKLEEREKSCPLVFDLSYLVDGLTNVSGGIERGSNLLGSMLLQFDLDGERALGWNGSHFFVALLGIHGGPFSDRVGDFQTVSNIEATPTVSFFEAKYTQVFLDDFTFQLGLLALDSDFDIRSSAELFVHSSPGTGGDIGQLGLNGPGIFPIGALGARLAYEHDGYYAQVAVVEGVPGDPENEIGNTFRFSKGEGLFVIGELGHIWEDEVGELGKVGLGAWGFTAGYETHLDPDVLTSNEGVYLTLEKAVFREREDPSQGLTAFLRTGLAEGRVNPIQTFVGAGLVYTGAFPGRHQDRLGLAVNSGFAGQEFMDSGPFERHETALELTYAFTVNDSLSIQPGLQYVVNPGFDPALDNSLILGLRAVSTFATQ